MSRRGRSNSWDDDIVPPSPISPPLAPNDHSNVDNGTIAPIFIPAPPQPTTIIVPTRGRSRSRSHSPMYRYRDGSRSPSRSPSRRRHTCRSRSPSPYTLPHIYPSPPQVTIIPPPSRYITPPLVEPPIWPPPKQPVDILTFHYNRNMAYAPAARTYDEAIDTVLELWPELRDVERDHIKLLVTGSDHLVRVPKMSWQAVLLDLPRYEVVHVTVDEIPPPPKYQGKGKGRMGDEKGRRSSGFFSSIKSFFG